MSPDRPADIRVSYDANEGWIVRQGDTCKVFWECHLAGFYVDLLMRSGAKVVVVGTVPTFGRTILHARNALLWDDREDDDEEGKP